jgi:hypothetical protein
MPHRDTIQTQERERIQAASMLSRTKNESKLLQCFQGQGTNTSCFNAFKDKEQIQAASMLSRTRNESKLLQRFQGQGTTQQTARRGRKKAAWYVWKRESVACVDNFEGVAWVNMLGGIACMDALGGVACVDYGLLRVTNERQRHRLKLKFTPVQQRSAVPLAR